MIVVDAAVVAELVRPHPSEAVLAWARSAAGADVSTTAVSVAELFGGLPGGPPDDGRRALEGVLDAFAGRVLPFDRAAAERYGRIVSARDRAVRPVAPLDAQVVAICLVHGAALATRDTRRLEGLGVDLVDPWRYAY